MFRIFKKTVRPVTRAEAEEALNDAIFTCGVVMGSKWMAWKLTDVLETITKEDSEVIQAWDGLHAVYAFEYLDKS